MQIRPKRNWSDYNQKLKKIARIDFFISERAIEQWHYQGKRSSGGKILYSNHVIELCLLIKEFYHLAYRQTEGFISSVFELMQLKLPIPDYTTVSRRAGSLEISFYNRNITKANREAMVIAIDSTGLSLYTRSDWNHVRHNVKKQHGYEKWRKLHIAIDVKTGEIQGSKYTKPMANDGPELPGILDAIEADVSAVCADMAYDTVNCRKAIQAKGARQLIPPIRQARVSRKNRSIRRYREILYERDEAIEYIKHNTINGDQSLARASWKEKSGYHARSLIETTMWQIKAHCSDQLTNKREDTRATQAKIKCKAVNLIVSA